MSTSITIKGSDGEFSAYLATPKEGHGRGSAVVVIQEIFGVNADMKETCDNFARAGFVAICPDLYWRQERDVVLTDKTEAEWKKALALYNGFNVDKGVSDIADTIDAARKIPGVDGGVGTVGYCLGGLLAYLTATRTTANAAVSYYGVGIEKYLEESTRISSPLLMHVAEEDEFVPSEARAKIVESLGPTPLVTIQTYPGCQHAFARNEGVHYVDSAAKLANARTLEHFISMKAGI